VRVLSVEDDRASAPRQETRGRVRRLARSVAADQRRRAAGGRDCVQAPTAPASVGLFRDILDSEGVLVTLTSFPQFQQGGFA
jgi:hypothetical protein